MVVVAVSVKKLDVEVGDVVEIDGRRYDVVRDRVGAGVALEPAISQGVDEIHGELGGRSMGAEEFADRFGDLPTDGDR